MTSSNFVRLSGVFLMAFAIASCGVEAPPDVDTSQPQVTVEPRPDIYADFKLTADLSTLTDNQREMIKLLIDASQIMELGRR